MTSENRAKRYASYKGRGNEKAVKYMEERWPDEFPIKEPEETKSEGEE